MKRPDEILIQILARTDAAWLPLRNWAQPNPANVYFARRDFAACGVPWESGAATEAGRKEAQHELEALAVEKLVRVFRPRGIKALGVRLTEKGDAGARRLCALPGLEAGMASLAEVARIAGAPGKWVPETALANVVWGVAGSGKQFALVEDRALPALSRGWLRTNSDIAGRVYYAATKAGMATLQAKREEEPEAPKGPLSDEECEARAFYLDCLDASLARLATAPPQDPREIGDIPLPVSMGVLVGKPVAAPLAAAGGSEP